jgi:prophage regulatory protein
MPNDSKADVQLIDRQTLRSGAARRAISARWSAQRAAVSDAHAPERLLRRNAVLALIGDPTPETLWRWIREENFPEPVRLRADGRILAWRESEVTAWIESRARGSGPQLLKTWAARQAGIERRKEAARQDEAARQAENVRQGRTPVFGFVRGN